MAGRLKGKVAVVTGAAPRGEGVGNGMATAILFAREGARVVLPEGTPAVHEFYDLKKTWPAESLERRFALKRG
jgi:NAD(P)-dependent dehydrogenase (short-subunit alcohol dehydrogenase family)